MAVSDAGTAGRDGEVHYHANALTRGLSLLETVAAGPTPTTLLDIHQRTGLPKSTLVRLLSVLEETGFLVRVDERPAYRLGHRVLPLAQAYLRDLDLSAVATPHLQPVVDRIGQTANVGVLDGRHVLHVCVVPPARSLRFANVVGERADAHSTGLGKCLLAQLPDDELAAHLPTEPFPAATAHTLTTMAELARELRTIRRRHHSIDDNENEVGVRCVAVPIVVDGEAVAALSVAGPAAEHTAEARRRYLAELQAAAAELAADPDVAAALRQLNLQYRSPA